MGPYSKKLYFVTKGVHSNTTHVERPRRDPINRQRKDRQHGFRNPMRFFADDDGVCGACGTNFRTRLPLLDHLSDSRRTHCRDVCNGGTVTKLSNERVEELDEMDRVARTSARQSGHFCETKWALACACTAACLEFERTCSWKVDLLSVTHACLIRVESFLVTSLTSSAKKYDPASSNIAKKNKNSLNTCESKNCT